MYMFISAKFAWAALLIVSCIIQQTHAIHHIRRQSKQDEQNAELFQKVLTGYSNALRTKLNKNIVSHELLEKQKVALVKLLLQEMVKFREEAVTKFSDYSYLRPG